MNKFLLLLYCCCCLPAIAAPMLYLAHAPESDSDHRYDFHWQLLRQALETTRAQWGDYTLRFVGPMSESRQLKELARPGGQLSVVIRETSLQYEMSYLPVRIPIDRGLLSYRVLLIRSEQQAALARVRSVAELRPFRILQGEDWGDVGILQANGLQVVTDMHYDNLFRLLDKRHGEVFSRGVSEVEDELRQFGPRYPSLVLEQELLLYYPLANYFWFAPSKQGARLAARVEAGMRQLLRDGRYRQLFRQYYGATLERLRLKQRRLLSLHNPVLPAKVPLTDPQLWYDPYRE